MVSNGTLLAFATGKAIGLPFISSYPLLPAFRVSGPALKSQERDRPPTNTQHVRRASTSRLWGPGFRALTF